MKSGLRQKRKKAAQNKPFLHVAEKPQAAKNGTNRKQSPELGTEVPTLGPELRSLPVHARKRGPFLGTFSTPEEAARAYDAAAALRRVRDAQLPEGAAMTVVNPFERFERIERAYTAALAGRAPEGVNIVELLPAIFAAVPDTSTQEIAEALRWSARKDLRQADKLERGGAR